MDAEKYIKDFNFKIVDKAETINCYSKSLKRKRIENPAGPISSLTEHIKKVFYQ